MNREAKLVDAVRKERPDNVVKWLGKGANANVTLSDGGTPLHIASKHGQEEIANILLDAGADAKAVDVRGTTPLHWAETTTIARLLLEAGADVNARTLNCDDYREGFDDTPLHYAAGWERHGEIIAILLAVGAEVDARNNLGMTPLHIAAGSGYIENITALVDGHADLNAKDKEGRTPVAYGMRDSFGARTPIRFLQGIVTLVNAGAAISAADRKRLSHLLELKSALGE